MALRDGRARVVQAAEWICSLLTLVLIGNVVNQEMRCDLYPPHSSPSGTRLSSLSANLNETDHAFQTGDEHRQAGL
ncbi:hypothetical protein HD806DRAFT_491431 [Xylariaceae sp. AK1471]|nr:hypothetical protein HD806DRAFT_491431 [Xylariaceae sp. AK1471]